MNYMGGPMTVFGSRSKQNQTTNIERQNQDMNQEKMKVNEELLSDLADTQRAEK